MPNHTSTQLATKNANSMPHFFSAAQPRQITSYICTKSTQSDFIYVDYLVYSRPPAYISGHGISSTVAYVDLDALAETTARGISLPFACEYLQAHIVARLCPARLRIECGAENRYLTPGIGADFGYDGDGRQMNGDHHSECIAAILKVH